MSHRHYGLLIDNQFVNSSDESYYAIVNPATGEVVGEVCRATTEDVDAAVDSAYEAFQSWCESDPRQRAEILTTVAHQIQASEDKLARLLTMEQGKTIAESRAELRMTSHALEYYATLATHSRDRYIRLDEGEHGFVWKSPIGVCAAISPWNAPVVLSIVKVAPALAGGNTVVLKPASTTPLTVLEVGALFVRAGLPKGVLNIVVGPGAIVGETLIRNPKVRKIAFTGETETGKHVMEVAAKGLKRVTLELGGSDPMIVCDDADLDSAVNACVLGRYRNAGQTCNSVKRLYITKGIAQTFVRKLVERVNSIVVGNGLDPHVGMGPLHTLSQRNNVEEMVSDALQRGARVLAGGIRPENTTLSSGYYYLPTLLAEVDESSRVCREECFGPVLPVFTVADLKEAISRANDSPYGLDASIWTRDMEKAMWAAKKLEVGTVWINNLHVPRIEMPFGGVKNSGIGRELGLEGLEEYLTTKSIILHERGKTGVYSLKPLVN
ncbi:MAG: aldehyde dehydrogenase family protein [Candidatus Caldarchaeum sp.]